MKKYSGALLLTLAALIWGTAFVAQSMGNAIGPYTFNSARYFVGAVVLLPVIFCQKKLDPAAASLSVEEKKRDRRTLWVGGLCCGCALFAASNLQQVGLIYTSVGKAGFLTALYIVIVPVLGIFLKKKVPLLVWCSIVIAVVGTYLLSVKEDLTIGLGDLLEILAAVCFSFHILFIDHFSPRVNGVKLSAIQFLVSGLLTLVLALLFESPQLLPLLQNCGPILYTGMLSCGIGYTLQIIGQKNTPPAVATLVMSLESVFAALSGWLILGQNLSENELFGCVLVFVAVLLAQLPVDQWIKNCKKSVKNIK